MISSSCATTQWIRQFASESIRRHVYSISGPVLRPVDTPYRFFIVHFRFDFQFCFSPSVSSIHPSNVDIQWEDAVVPLFKTSLCQSRLLSTVRFHHFSSPFLTVLPFSVIPLFPPFPFCFIIRCNVISYRSMSFDVHHSSSYCRFMVILVSPSHRSVPSSLTVVFFCHNVELSIKIIRSCLVRRIWFMLLCHVVVSSLLVIPVNVSRCQLSLKLFNHLSIVGICLATLFYRLSRFVLLTIVSRF